MSRQLPIKPNERQKLIIKAVADYYGDGINKQEKSDSKVIALSLMGRKARLPLMSDEQKKDMWAIKINLGDETYTRGLSE